MGDSTSLGAARLGRDGPLQVSLCADPLAGTAAQPFKQLIGPVVRLGWVCLCLPTLPHRSRVQGPARAVRARRVAARLRRP